MFGLRNDFFEITSCREGESALRYAVSEGDIILADRHYGKAKAFDYITANKGDCVMRLKHKAADCYDANGKKTDLIPLLESIRTGEVLDVTLYYKSDRRAASPLKPLRICAIRKSAEQIARARRSTLRSIKKVSSQEADRPEHPQDERILRRRHVAAGGLLGGADSSYIQAPMAGRNRF